MKQGYLFDTHYRVAIVAAPIFCLLYIWVFDHKADDIYWLIKDIRSLLFLVFLYPIVEEVIFRGFIQEYITNKLKNQSIFLGLSIANLLTSLLFVSIHFIHHPPIWATLVLFPSLIFGYFKDKYIHIAPSIVLHMFYNLCFFSLISN